MNSSHLPWMCPQSNKVNEGKTVVICAVIFLTQVSGMRRFELGWNHSRALTARALPPPFAALPFYSGVTNPTNPLSLLLLRAASVQIFPHLPPDCTKRCLSSPVNGAFMTFQKLLPISSFSGFRVFCNPAVGLMIEGKTT